MPVADNEALAPHEIAQHPRPGEGMTENRLVKPPHELQSLGRDRPRHVVGCGAGEAERLRLSGDREVMAAVDQLFALDRATLPSAPDKKSFSKVSSPILA